MTMLREIADEARQTWISTPHGDDVWGKVAEAMLCKLMEPSEEMISAMMHGFHLNKAPRQAMHDALVNGLCFVETEKDEPQQEDDVA